MYSCEFQGEATRADAVDAMLPRGWLGENFRMALCSDIFKVQRVQAKSCTSRWLRVVYGGLAETAALYSSM